MLTVCRYLNCNIAGSKTRPAAAMRRDISASEEVFEALFLSERVMVQNMADCPVGDT